MDTKLEGAFQQTESQLTHRQYASDTNQAVVYSMVPFQAFLELPNDWSLEPYPQITTVQQPSQIESYTDVTAHNFDGGDIYRETLKAFKGTAPTDDGLVPHSSLSVGTHTVSAILGSYAVSNKPLAISQRTKSTLMLDQADEQTSFLDVYKAADSDQVRDAITARHRRGGTNVLGNQTALDQVVSAQSDAFIGVVPETDEGGQSPSMFGDDSDDSSDDSNNDSDDDDSKDDDTKDDDEALAAAFFARWDEYIDWLTAAASDATDSSFRFEDRFWLDLETWMDSEKSWQDDQDDYLNDLTSDWPGSDDTSTQKFGGGGNEGGGTQQQDPEPLVRPGEGYEATIDLTNIDDRKLKELINDGTLAKAFNITTGLFSGKPSVEPTQSINKADIIVLGAEEGLKIAVIKKTVPILPDVAGYVTKWIFNRTIWQGWTGSSGDFKTFGWTSAFTGRDHYEVVAEAYAYNKAVDHAYALASGLEFTMNVIPFGAGVLNIADHEGEWTGWDVAEAGVMFATDTVAVIVPVAKGVQASKWFVNWERTQKLAKAVANNAKTMEWTAGGLEAVIAGNHVAEDIQKNGKLTWSSSGELIGILLNIGIIRLARKSPTGETKPPGSLQSGVDATKNPGVSAASKPGTELKTADLQQIEQEAINKRDELRRTIDGTPTTPQPVSPRQVPGDPEHWEVVRNDGNKVAPGEVFDNIGDARQAADKTIKSTVVPWGGLKDLSGQAWRSDPASYYTYNELRSQIKQSGLSGRGVGLEAHHLLEKQFAARLGLNPNDIIAVPLTPKWHRNVGGFGMNFDAAVNAEIRILGSSPATASAEIIWKAHRDVYLRHGYREWAEAIHEAYFASRGIEF